MLIVPVQQEGLMYAGEYRHPFASFAAYII